MTERLEDYEIRLSRTPDGKLIITADPSVPLANDCMVGTPDEGADIIYVHLDVIHNGTKYPVWVCLPRDYLEQSDLESAIMAEKGAEIIASLKKMEQP